MNAREQTYFWVLVATFAWTLVSASGITTSIERDSEAFAWGWAASFALSAVVAAYCFGRLL